MDILNKRSMEITAMAMDGLAARHKAITSNIANANTSGYSRIEVEFEGQLNRFLQNGEKTGPDKEDFKAKYSAFKPQIIITPSDGTSNNVNIEMEMAELAKNSMRYNALAAMQAKALKGMQEVIRGGGR